MPTFPHIKLASGYYVKIHNPIRLEAHTSAHTEPLELLILCVETSQQSVRGLILCVSLSSGGELTNTSLWFPSLRGELAQAVNCHLKLV